MREHQGVEGEPLRTWGLLDQRVRFLVRVRMCGCACAYTRMCLVLERCMALGWCVCLISECCMAVQHLFSALNCLLNLCLKPPIRASVCVCVCVRNGRGFPKLAGVPLLSCVPSNCANASWQSVIPDCLTLSLAHYLNLTHTPSLQHSRF